MKENEVIYKVNHPNDKTNTLVSRYISIRISVFSERFSHVYIAANTVKFLCTFLEVQKYVRFKSGMDNINASCTWNSDIWEEKRYECNMKAFMLHKSIFFPYERLRLFRSKIQLLRFCAFYDDCVRSSCSSSFNTCFLVLFTIC